MSYRYPQDRHLDRKEKGAQPYLDVREATARERAGIQAEAEAFGEDRIRTQEERELDAEERLVPHQPGGCVPAGRRVTGAGPRRGTDTAMGTGRPVSPPVPIPGTDHGRNTARQRRKLPPLRSIRFRHGDS